MSGFIGRVADKRVIQQEVDDADIENAVVIIAFNGQYTSTRKKIKKPVEMFADKPGNISISKRASDKSSGSIHPLSVIPATILFHQQFKKVKAKPQRCRYCFTNTEMVHYNREVSNFPIIMQEEMPYG